MSSKLTIWNAVLSTLQAAQTGTLSYVKKVYDGVYPNLDDIPPQAFPVIMMEPDEDTESWFATGAPPEIKSVFRVALVCLVRESKFNKGISGDTTVSPVVTGLLQFVDDVKNTLQADQTLGGTAGMQKLTFPKTTYFFEGYPIREAKIIVELTNQIRANAH